MEGNQNRGTEVLLAQGAEAVNFRTKIETFTLGIPRKNMRSQREIRKEVQSRRVRQKID